MISKFDKNPDSLIKQLLGTFSVFLRQSRLLNLVPQSLSLIVLFTFFLVTACSSGYLPQANKSVSVNNGYAVLDKEGVVLTLNYQQWVNEPQKLPQYYTSFYLTIRNRTEETITIKPESITLLDEDNNQYDLVSPAAISEILLSNEFFFNNWTQGSETLSSERHEEIINSRMLGRANIMQEAFHFGDILSGAQRKGYIFFNRLPSKNRRITISFADENIIFTKK